MQLHHVTLYVSEIERSIRFYRDGLGLVVLVDREFDGDWPTLLGASSTRLRAVILGESDDPNVGQVELVTFAEPVPVGAPPATPVTGSVMLSFLVDLHEVMPKLEQLGVTDANRITLSRGNDVVSVRDPDGIVVELLGSTRPARATASTTRPERNA